jgi:hypothetical protein
MSRIEACFITLASVLIISFFGSTNAFAFSLPGINASGLPAFTNNVRVHLNPHGKLKLMAPNSTFSLDTGSDFYVGTRGNYRMTAYFTDAGVFESGAVTLFGKIEQLGISKKTLLMTADLTGANMVDDPYLWGFNTTNIWCSPELMLECTNSESIYVALSNAFSGDFERNFMAMGIAVTTVPIPAAVWLFGSALGLLVWIRHKII